ncbi:MAPEG family protein [Thalassotalea aquiviva]|uniref:MAPEG family protein n=1 Tax=Thalassotalea aquiviva TaxID=3242415 RepID=UPI00352B44D0
MEHSTFVTGFYAGIIAILHLGLSFRVIGLRRSLKIGIGDGGNKTLAKAIRVHGNFIEHVPVALILLILFELAYLNPLYVHILGGVLVASRALHAVGLGKSVGVSWQRFIGTLGTFLVILMTGMGLILAQM